MTKVLSLRVPDELAAWADEYAAARGVTRQALLEEGLRSFKDDCESGVPEIREAARHQSTVKKDLQGVGDCPKRPGELGHVWEKASVDGTRPCIFCGMAGRGARDKDGREVEQGYFERATEERSLLFARLRAPDSAHGRVKK